jgi:hypothetical protein
MGTGLLTLSQRLRVKVTALGVRHTSGSWNLITSYEILLKKKELSWQTPHFPDWPLNDDKKIGNIVSLLSVPYSLPLVQRQSLGINLE